ncbi:hypothetical protein N788_09495 [Arenimonas donghaensis DSM 18148 = HO3-R19]|uniref:DUF4185 domain-containing protein n=1 Tax=Arenimonas donghaensis DSM 18148 = HO3-R19 TaxID=1121014 RepID=A0A087MKL4_9GAMM|nr:hypothetical protein N788_09495 [Arenimonas donghaensis DSM 18148 = HO3-R19]
MPDGPLLVFLFRMVETPGRDLGFAARGYALAIVANPRDSAGAWRVRIVDAPPAPFDAAPATAVVHEQGYVVALAIRQQGTHAGALVRYRPRHLVMGDLAGAEWWAGVDRGWVREPALGPDGPAWVMDDAGAEASVHRDACTGRYVHVASYGFGDTEIGMRDAPALVGPWSKPRRVYRPPESDRPDAFVYAAKAHPWLGGPDEGAAVTYATNRFRFEDLVEGPGAYDTYWPRVLRMPGC